MRDPGGRLAVSVMPLENRRETLLAVATAADRLGYHGYFLPETWAFDVTVLPAEARARSARWYEAGADMLTLLLSPNLTPAAVDFTLNTFHPLAAAPSGRA